MHLRIIMLILAVMLPSCVLNPKNEFVPLENEYRFEKWRLLPEAWAQKFRASSNDHTDHVYRIGCIISTFDPGFDEKGGYQPSSFEAQIESLNVRIVDGKREDHLALGKLVRGPLDDKNRAVSLHTEKAIQIPPDVQTIQMTVAVAFRNRRTGMIERHVYDIPMRKQESMFERIQFK